MNDALSPQKPDATIDPMQLCEHCPFAPQTGEGTGQESGAEKALGAVAQTQEIDLQLSLPFEGEWGHQEESESADPRPSDDIAQRLALTYLLHAPDRSHIDALSAIDLADADRSDIKAELEHIERQSETEKVMSEESATLPADHGQETLVSLSTQEADHTTSNIQASEVAKSTSHRLAEEQKGTASSGGQSLAQAPSREASKDGQAAEHEQS
ncbi:MAG: hypothetical protein R3A44_30770 [Caldilineaceae bacterium]